MSAPNRGPIEFSPLLICSSALCACAAIRLKSSAISVASARSTAEASSIARITIVSSRSSAIGDRNFLVHDHLERGHQARALFEPSAAGGQKSRSQPSASAEVGQQASDLGAASFEVADVPSDEAAEFFTSVSLS